MPGFFLLSPGPVFLDPNQQTVQENATLTVSGSTILRGYGVKEINLVVNVKATPTGTLPTLQYTLQEVDPGDGATVFGSSATTVSINAIGVYAATLRITQGGALKVSWAVGGTTPSFTQVYATLTSKATSAATGVDGSGVERLVLVDNTGRLEITGAISATNPSVGTNAAAAPASSTQVGGSDGTNLQAARVFDADTAGGTQYVLGAVLRKAASGGSVEAGTATDPLRVDPTGTTAQPVTDNGGSLTVDGTVTANVGTTGGLALDATLTGGTQKAIIRGGAKGSTVAADVTSTASGANHQPVDVAIYDAAGNQITSFGGGTQYTVNDPAPADPIGPTLVAERDDQLSPLSEAEGDWTQVRASAKGALWVTIPDANGDPITAFGGGQQYADGVARGTATGTLAMVDDGTNIQSAAGDSAGRQIVVGAAADAAAVAGNPVLVAGSDGTDARTLRTATDGTVRTDPTGTTTQPVSGTVTADQGAPAAYINRWPVQVTDGTNSMPTADAAARALYVTGSKTNDGAAPVADNLGALIAVASASVPVYTEGRQVLLTATLGGELRTVTSLAPDTATKEIAFGKIALGGGTSGQEFPVRQTPYVEPTTQAQRSLVSSSAADSAAGTGARQVAITYVNGAMTGQFTEVVTLNGTTPVNTVATDIRFIQHIRVVSVGSGGQNAGTISLYTGLAGAGTVIGTIGTGVGKNNQTYWAHHYVLDGETAVIVTFNAGVAGGGAVDAEAFIATNNPLVATSPQLQITDSITVSASAASTPRVVPNTVDITGPAFMIMKIIPAGNNASLFGSFDFWEDLT